MFWHKVDHKGDNNEKTHGYDNYPSVTGGCVINLAKEHGNEEDEEFKEDTDEISDTDESKIGKGISSILAKQISFKVTQVVIFSINNYQQYMISVENKNQTDKNKDRWNYCNHMQAPAVRICRTAEVTPTGVGIRAAGHPWD